MINDKPAARRRGRRTSEEGDREGGFVWDLPLRFDT